MKKLVIEKMGFRMAFDWHLAGETCLILFYLDMETGDIIGFFEEDEMTFRKTEPAPEKNKQLQEQIEASPDRYLKISGLFEVDHHENFPDFLNSDWNDNKGFHKTLYEAHFRSLKDWITCIDISAYLKFCDAKRQRMAEEFLRKNGIDPEWT